MHYKLGFSQTSDSCLLVLTDVRDEVTGDGGIFATRFEDENSFFRSVVDAGLGDDAISTIIAAGLLALCDDPPDATWVDVTSTMTQLQGMGLHIDLDALHRSTVNGFAPNSSDLAAALTASPSPIAVLKGPQHTFSFINPAYVRMMGRKSAESVLGKPVRDALPELHGQPFFPLLDQVYRTGEPFIGREVPARLMNEETGELNECFFDFVYFPVRDASGDVYSILSQANDVSDRVLARQVSEAREMRLYEQWAELEALYNNSPFGMALVDVKEYRLLRINKVNAALIGRPPHELIGQRASDLFPDLHQLTAIYERVKQGEEVRNIRFDIVPADKSRPMQQIMVNFNPVLNARGEVTAIASISVNLAEPMHASEHVLIDLAARANFSS